MPLQRPLEVAATSDFGSEVFYYIVSDVCKISKFEDGHANFAPKVAENVWNDPIQRCSIELK